MIYNGISVYHEGLRQTERGHPVFEQCPEDHAGYILRLFPGAVRRRAVHPQIREYSRDSFVRCDIISEPNHEMAGEDAA